MHNQKTIVQKLSEKHAEQVVEVLSTYANEKNFASFGLNWSPKQVQESLSHLAWGLFGDQAGEQKLISFIFFRRAHEALLELDLMVTRKDMTQNNYMKHLFDQVLKELHAGEIWLEVHENNVKAEKFYLKHGFIRVGERPRYYPDGSKAILMSLKRA